MKPKHRTVCTRRKYKSIRSRRRSIAGKLFDVSHAGMTDDGFFRVGCSLWVDEAGGGTDTLASVYEQSRPFRSHCSQGAPPAHLVLALLQLMHERSTRRLLSPASVLSSLIPLLLSVLPDEYTHSSPYRRHRRHPPRVRSHLTLFQVGETEIFTGREHEGLTLRWRQIRQLTGSTWAAPGVRFSADMWR